MNLRRNSNAARPRAVRSPRELLARNKDLLLYVVGHTDDTGVGPYAPAGNNTTDAGKQKNRRVELVKRLR